jgi:hydrogenase nickel incorporation protein HypA/HybF
MHEMSIALGIVDLAMEYATREGAEKVLELELDIGTHSGVEITALRSAMEIAVKDTPLEQSLLRVNEIRASAECSECGHSIEVETPLSGCPVCGNPGIRIIRRKELQLKSLLVE